MEKVSTPDTSKKILESARLHPVMGVRLACISNLDVTKSKYHISCYTKFFRETLHNKDTVKDPDTTMALLCKELQIRQVMEMFWNSMKFGIDTVPFRKKTMLKFLIHLSVE